MLEKDGITLGPVPANLLRDMERGRGGVEIAVELMQAFAEAGMRGVYLVPPILRGGARDYEAAQRVLQDLGR